MLFRSRNIKVADLFYGYADNGDEGVVGYGGKLDIRPPYQREFVYDPPKRNAVIMSVLKSYPLNVMYWDIDRRGLNSLINFYRVVAHQYRLAVDRPEVYVAPKYEWREVDRTPGGNSVHEFMAQREVPPHGFH